MKKKIIAVILVLAVVLGLGAGAYFLFFAGDDTPPTPEVPACVHIDLNGDGNCERCFQRFACGGDHTDMNGDLLCDWCRAEIEPEGPIDVAADDVDTLNQKYSAMAPTMVVTTSSQSFGSYSLTGSSVFKMGKVDGYKAAVFYNSYQQLRDLESGSGSEIVDMIETVTETWEYSEDLGYRENGGKWDPYGYDFTPNAGDIAIKLNRNNIKDFNNDKVNNKVTFKVEASKVKAVFGESLTSHKNYTIEGDVEVTITYSVADITGIKIEYTAKNSKNKDHPTVDVVIAAEYSYKTQIITFQ